MGRVFVNCPGDLGSIPGPVIQGDAEKKTEPIYFRLKFIDLILAISFFSGYEVDFLLEKLGPE